MNVYNLKIYTFVSLFCIKNVFIGGFFCNKAAFINSYLLLNYILFVPWNKSKATINLTILLS